MPDHPGEPIIRVRGLVNRFGRETVHEGLDLDVFRGEVLGVDATTVVAHRDLHFVARAAVAPAHANPPAVRAVLDRIRQQILERSADRPLVVPEGAVVIDTTGLEVDEVVERIAALVPENAR